LSVRADIERVFVDADAGALERVVLNLLRNAIKFTPEGGHIALDTVATDNEVTVTVSDNGIGIPLDEQSQLFDRFFRSTVSQEQFIQGTGLGLAISKGIVEEHGGSLQVTLLRAVDTRLGGHGSSAGSHPGRRGRR
jgi:hypothetical protein